MNDPGYELVSDSYTDTGQVPKDENLVYKCKICLKCIASIPQDNGGCECGNVFIDKDYWRLVVANFNKFEVLRELT
jgi:hypothetical protein